MSGKRFWQFRASADKKSADLLLYGYISETSWWGDEVTPKEFAADLKALGDVVVLNVYINSQGGDVFAGQAIYSQLKRHKAHVVVHVDGIAASIASVIAMAGDEVLMPQNAMMMIHHPWTWGAGNASELRELAETLDNIGKTIVAVYREKTGLKDEEILQLMSDETWFTAEEAVKKGFADRVEGARAVAASLRGSILSVGGRDFDIGKFVKFPRDLVAAVQPSQGSSAPHSEMKGARDVELTQEILARDYSEIHAAVLAAGRAEGVTAERARLQAIDELAGPGVEQIVQRAKYETGASAEQVAVEIVKAEKAKAVGYLAGIKADAQPLSGVKPTAVLGADESRTAELQNAQAAFAKGANERRDK